MSAVTSATTDPVAEFSDTATAARRLATAYDQYISAVWRGEGAGARAFNRWLAAFWREGPPEPLSPPLAISPHGWAGQGIRWYETPFEVLGYVGPAREESADAVMVACYRVPIGAAPPPIRPDDAPIWTPREPLSPDRSATAR